MRADRKPTAVTASFVGRAVIALQMLVLAVGALLFVLAQQMIDHPVVAVVALAMLTVSIVLEFTLPTLRHTMYRRHLIAAISLLVCGALLIFATGAARSPLQMLLMVPLAVVALAFGRWWLVLLAAALSALVVLLLASLPDSAVAIDAVFIASLLAWLAPATAVTIVIAALIGEMQSAVQRISDLASTDSLTGLLNLRAFDEVLQQEHRRAERFNRPYALVVIDADNLRQVNESMGKEAGDQLLVSIAAAIGRSIRGSDIAGRLGGDEFIVLLSEADATTATAIALRIRNNIYAGTVSVANRLIRASACLGTACFPDDHLYPRELMGIATQKMQQDRELRKAPAADL